METDFFKLLSSSTQLDTVVVPKIIIIIIITMSESEPDAGGSANGGSIDLVKRYEPINPTNSRDAERQLSRRDSHRSSRSSHSSRSLDRVVSLTDGYSHHAVDHDILQEPSDEEKPRIPPDAGFTVQWDGPNDPDNPRNMSLMRRWLIVLVVSIGSLCVYVDIPLLSFYKVYTASKKK